MLRGRAHYARIQVRAADDHHGPRTVRWRAAPLNARTRKNSLQILLANTSHTGLPRTHRALTRAAHSPHTARARLQHALSPVPSDAQPVCVTYVAPRAELVLIDMGYKDRHALGGVSEIVWR